MAATRPGASYMTVPRSSAAIRASRSRRSRPLRGRNPSNDQRGPATPLAATAASTADAPGIGTTVPALGRPGGDELVAGIAHAGRAGVGHEGEVLAAAQVLEQLRVRPAPLRAW